MSPVASPRITLGTFLLVGLALPAAAVERAVLPSFSSADLDLVARYSEVGWRLRLADVEEEGSSRTAAFVLERFAVFAPDAKVTIHGAGGLTRVEPAPANQYFRGTIEGEPDSHVFLAVLEDGRVQGIVRRGQQIHFIGDDSAPLRLSDRRLLMRPVLPWALEARDGQGFTCGNDRLPGRGPAPDNVFAPSEQRPLSVQTAAAGSPAHTAQVAIETDFEYYSLFNNTTNATNYAGNLIGYSSSTAYVPEINTSLVVQSVELWTTSSDPWTQTSSACGLAEFGKYWNANKTSVNRTTAAFLSGKPTGGGIAWLGVLCSLPFSTGMAASCPGLGSENSPGWGGAYAFIGSIGAFGLFDINAPSIMWDIMAVTHEIGHNFNSPHSHCYNGIGGSSSPIDQCYSGECKSTDSFGNCLSYCYQGATQTPGPAGQHSGTVMSYCHLVNSSYGDISLDFGGNGFPYGVLPGREAALINNYVSSIASSTCLAGGPSIGSISPGRGGTKGGTSVTITGANFHQSAVSVTFGGTAGTSPATSNCTSGVCTTITVTTPAHASGAVNVVVTNTDTSTSTTATNGFTYATTSVSSVTPASGPTAGGTAITISGDNFQSGATVKVGGVAATSVVVVNLTTITARTPAGAAGNASVQVANTDATTATKSPGFLYANPTAAENFYTLAPCRVLDTRNANGTFGGPALGANGSRLFPIYSSSCGVPANAVAISANITVVSPTAGGFVAAYPGNAFPLGTSNVSFSTGQTRAVNAVLTLATDGSGTIGFQNAAAGSTNLILDVNGYFAP